MNIENGHRQFDDIQRPAIGEPLGVANGPSLGPADEYEVAAEQSTPESSRSAADQTGAVLVGAFLRGGLEVVDIAVEAVDVPSTVKWMAALSLSASIGARFMKQSLKGDTR